jgi:NADPH-dependent 2,4-dienoyl-CoA reductase/sulfur reductase-like enzyme
LPITCAINPAAGRERELAIQPAKKRKKVLVVGAGPAGLEAARVANLRGHRVILMDQEKRMGGQLVYASKSPHKKEFEEVIEFLKYQLKKAKVDIRLGKEATQTVIKKTKPHAVILATGATPIIPFISGVDKPHVHTAIETLDQRVSLKGKTVVIGGGLVGLETALFLIENHVSPIIIIEPTDKLGGSVGLRMGWYVRNRINTHPDIEVRTETTVEEIKDDSIIVQKKGEFEELQVKNVILAAGMGSNNTLAEALKAEGTIEELYVVGDANIPRTMKEAFEEAALAARRI